MKQLTYLLTTIIALSFTACGDTAVETVDEKVETIELKGFEELDVTEWGFNLIIMIPQADTHGDPEVTLTESGALQVVVGSGFGIEIMYGDADIELLKMDLQEDLVFTSEILKEEENAIIYTQDIPDSGVKIQNHFLYRATFGTDVFEVRDLADGEYGTGMIEKMLQASKAIKVASSSEVTT